MPSRSAKQYKTLFDFKCQRIGCLTLGKAPKYLLAQSKYCSPSCSQEARKATKVEVICSFCKKVFEKSSSKLRSKSGLYFCTRFCKNRAQNIETGCKGIQPVIYTGKSVYRKRAIEKYGPSCKECGYNEHVKMLDVDHIDSNRENYSIENLQVLCVWCHALKTRKVV